MSDERWVWVPFQVDRPFDGFRVDRFLAHRLAAYSRARVQRILGEGRIQRAGRLLKASARVRAGDRIVIAYLRRPEAPLSPHASLPVLYEDEALLVVDKPAHLLSHPTDKIVQHTVTGVLRRFRADLKSLHLLHRLDRETSGALALAKSKEAARRWTEAMEKKQVRKEYVAFVRGIPSPSKGVIDWPIGRQGGEIKVRQGINVAGAVPAVTRYEVVDRATGGEAAIVRVFPETGRLHQIRVHFAALGHPILGDMLYQNDGEAYLKLIRHGLTETDRKALGFPRLALHAARLTFPHPLTGQTLTVSAPWPENMGAWRSALQTSRAFQIC